MAVDFDVFEILSSKNEMPVDPSELQNYESSTPGTYNLSEPDHAYLLSKMEHSSENTGSADTLSGNLESNPILEMNDKMLTDNLGEDPIDQMVKDESIQDTNYSAINAHLVGQTHPETGVPFEVNENIADPDVYPVFDSTYEVVIPEEHFESSPYMHTTYANEQLASSVDQSPVLAGQFTEMQLEQIQNGDTPDGYTWHHHEEPGRIQLVDSGIHSQTSHSGGMSLWGQGY